MSRALVLVLCACATPSANVAAPVAVAPPPPATCPSEAPSSLAFEPERVLGAKIERVCLLGSGDETHLRLNEIVTQLEGSSLDAAATRAALTELHETGLVHEASAFATALPSKAVVLTFAVVEREVVSEVMLEGAPSLPTAVRQQLEVRGFRDTPRQRARLLELVTDFYEAAGFARATVEFELRRPSRALVLKVNEGQRLMVQAVRFEGTRQQAALEKLVTTKVGSPIKPLVAERDALLLSSFYFDRGMVQATVTSKLDEHADGAVDVIFSIVEGDVFRIGTVSTKGFPAGTSQPKLETKKGAVFSRATVQRDLARLKERASTLGDVEVTPLSDVDPNGKIINLTFEFEKK